MLFDLEVNSMTTFKRIGYNSLNEKSETIYTFFGKLFQVYVF